MQNGNRKGIAQWSKTYAGKKFPHNLAAVHLRHLYVGEHDVGSRLRGDGYCLAGVYGDRKSVA